MRATLVAGRCVRITHPTPDNGPLRMGCQSMVMANYLRPRATGAAIFFTVSLAERGSDLLLARIDLLRDAVRRTRAERPFDIDAIVVLPDHLHAVLTLPAGDGDFATRWRLIKARFSMGVPRGDLRPSHLRRGERGVWQRRFWEHHIRDEADLVTHLRYCWTNPVRHGLVDRPEDWPFSSLHRDRREGRHLG